MLKSMLSPTLLALGARCACAFLTEFFPLFPPHYFIDAGNYHREARAIAESWSGAAPLASGFTLSPGRELYTYSAAALYRATGPRPLAAKLANAALASGSILAWQKLYSIVVGPQAAALSAVLLALWPSHIFYSSQNLKESMHLLALAATFLLLCPLPAAAEGAPRSGLLAAGSLALFLSGLLRSHLMPLLAASLALPALAAAFREPRRAARRRFAAGALAVVGTVAAFQTRSPSLLSKMHSGQSAAEGAFLKDTPRDVRPYTPAWITRIRRQRQASDQYWSRSNAGREIRTQIFPDADLRTWLDVLAFIPKGAFHVLFMPLPGLYPLEGSLGRALASLENTAILLLAAAAFPAILRGRAQPHVQCLAGFFLACLGVFSLFEFDLGSASRHKLLYLPAILPFAAAEILRRMPRPARCRP